MAFASKQTFGGQRATAGRVVLLAMAAEGHVGASFRAGIIVGVGSLKDEPHIRDLRTNEVIWTNPWTYYDAKTEADLSTMPVGSWCWPPRV